MNIEDLTQYDHSSNVDMLYLGAFHASKNPWAASSASLF